MLNRLRTPTRHGCGQTRCNEFGIGGGRDPFGCGGNAQRKHDKNEHDDAIDRQNSRELTWRAAAACRIRFV